MKLNVQELAVRAGMTQNYKEGVLEFRKVTVDALKKFFELATTAAAEREWVLFWRTGEKQVIKGPTIEQAFSSAGIGSGALGALDFYDEVNEDRNNKYVFNKETHEWDLLKE
jgi:hypothetical protein